MKKRRGFTLVELMIGILLASIVIALGMQLIRSSVKGFTATSKEYSVQNGVRASMDNIANITKEATAIFTVDKTKFDPNDLSKRKVGWSYVAVNEDGTKLLNHVWVWTDKKSGSGKHKVIDITPTEWNTRSAHKDIRYTIGFYQQDDGTNLSEDEENRLREKRQLSVNLTGKSSDGQDYSLKRDIKAENLYQILDSRTSRLKPITALAYKTDSLEDPIKKTAPAEAAVVFAIDISSSMMRDLAGKDHPLGSDGKPDFNQRIPEEDQRITILKKTAKKFVGELESSGAIDLYLVPFATNLFGEITRTVDTSTEQAPIERTYFELIDYTNGYKNNVTKVPITRWEIYKANAWGRSGVQLADKLLSLYEGVTWADPDIQAEFERIKRDIEDDKHKVNTVLPPSSNPWGFGDDKTGEWPRLTSVSRDLYKHCIQLMKIPFPLNVQNPQADKVIAYIDTYVHPMTNLADGKTNVGGGIREAFKMLDKSSKKYKYLIVLTDGNPSHFDAEGDVFNFQVFAKSNDGSVGTDASYGATRKDHIKLSGSPNYEDVGAGNGDSVYLATDVYGDVYGYVGPGNGTHINRQYQKVPEGDGDHFFYQSMDVVSPSKSRYPSKAPKPNPGDSIAVERFHRMDGIRNYTIGRNKDVFKGTHYIRHLTSAAYGYNIKQADGSPFINKTFLVGFSGVDKEKTMMKDYIKGYFEDGGGTAETVYYDATSQASLEDVFRKVTNAIQKEIWYFEGP